MNDFGQLAPHALSEKLRAVGCKNAFTAAWQGELAPSRGAGTDEEHSRQAFPTSLLGLDPSGFHIPSPILLQRQHVLDGVSRGWALCFLLAEASKLQCLSATFLGNQGYVGPTSPTILFLFFGCIVQLVGS